MFSEVCVSHSVRGAGGGGSHVLCGGRVSGGRVSRGRVFGGIPYPPPKPQKRAVRILLECFLVGNTLGSSLVVVHLKNTQRC